MKKYIKIIPSLLGGLVLIVAFQNCTNQSMTFQDSVFEDSLKFFSYKYTQASPYYYDVRVLKGPVVSSQETFQIIGAIGKSNPDDNSPISWRIRLMDTDGGYPPTVEGNNVDDGTQVYEVDLARAAGKTYDRLWIEITYNGQVVEHEVHINL